MLSQRYTHFRGFWFVLLGKIVVLCVAIRSVCFLLWLVWLSGLSASLWTKGSPIRFLVRSHPWVTGQVPSGGAGEATTASLSPSFLLSLKIKSFFKKCVFLTFIPIAFSIMHIILDLGQRVSWRMVSHCYFNLYFFDEYWGVATLSLFLNLTTMCTGLLGYSGDYFIKTASSKIQRSKSK